MNRVIVFCLLAAHAAPAAAASRSKPAPSEEEAAVAGPSSPGGVSASDRNRFARYLKGRLDKIQAFHKTRADFFAKETELWNAFWNKVRDDRRQFEIRMARQTLGLFDSLASLDPKDHAITIADFDRLQGNVVKSFEASQRQKLQDFFALHDTRWKDFAAEQERERAEFMAEALSGWDEQKAYLKSGRLTAPPAQESRKDAVADDEAPARKPAKARSKSRKAPIDEIDSWN